MSLREKTVSFGDLPEEIKLKIFSFLTQVELSQVISRVCTSWWAISKDPHLWKRVELRLEGKSKNLVQNSVEFVERCTLLEELYIASQFPKLLRIRDSVKKLTLDSTHLEKENLMKIVADCPFIEVLIFDKFYFHFTTIDLATYCASLVNLKKLEIYISDFHSSDMYFGDKGFEILARNCPKLACIKVNNAFALTDTGLTELARKCTKLQSLFIGGGNITDTGISELIKYRGQTLQEVCLRPSPLALPNVQLCNSCEYFGACKKMVSLRPSGIYSLSQNSLIALSELPVLEIVELSGRPFRSNFPEEVKNSMEEGFAIFFLNHFRKNLRKVFLTGFNLGEAALFNISMICSSLQVLQLSYCCGITDNGLIEIAEKCSQLILLNHDHCQPLTGDYEFNKKM